MLKRSSQRGMTWVTFMLIVLGVAAGYWVFVFAPIYLANVDIKQICAQTANMAYAEHNDDVLRKYIIDQVKLKFAIDETHPTGAGGPGFEINFDPQDVQLQRSDKIGATPPMVRIDVAYSRTITLPIIGSRRTLVFADHAEEDMSTVKW